MGGAFNNNPQLPTFVLPVSNVAHNAPHEEISLQPATVNFESQVETGISEETGQNFVDEAQLESKKAVPALFSVQS